MAHDTSIPLHSHCRRPGDFFALGGCANGVVMTDEEKVSCRDEGCAAFTMTELQTLVGKVFKDGYLKGWTDSNKQGGRNL